MSARAKKTLLLLLAVGLLFGSGRVEQAMNRDREQLGLTIAEPLQDAPPLLAFTTVALGGFRGLISNILWIRASDLQMNDKFFEAAQLADWITDLEPRIPQVWTFQAWNMAYNISVKFKENAPGDYSDRWRWVDRGIELLRDKGLRYNPDSVTIYQQLGWIFQHKLGANLDDGNIYYKEQWLEEMKPFFGPQGTNFESLIHPQTAGEKTNALALRDRFKIDPVFAQKVDEDYGPMDWRLPETQAIYWAAVGLQKAKEHPNNVNAGDLIQLRRIIFQSTLQAFHHGRIISNPFDHSVELAPNLDMISRANDVYLQFMHDDPASTDSIVIAHRNFLRDAIYFLYENNRITEAAKWFKYLGDTYPNQPIIENQPGSLPRNVTLDEFAVAAVQIDIGETSQERVTGAVEGMLTHAYLDLAIGQDDRAAGFQLLAQKVYNYYEKKSENQARIKLPPMNDLKRTVLTELLDPRNDYIPYAARAALRTQLGMGAETVSTNTVAPPMAISTNAPANTETNSSSP